MGKMKKSNQNGTKNLIVRPEALKLLEGAEIKLVKIFAQAPISWITCYEHRQEKQELTDSIRSTFN